MLRPRPSSHSARILLADDHGLFLEGMRQILEQEYRIVGLAGNGHEILELAEETKPDLVVMDISMPSLNGIETARQLKRGSNPRVKIVFVTMHSTPDYVLEAFRAGASGYVLKQSTAVELAQAIRQVLLGNSYVSPLVAREAMGMLSLPGESDESRHPLTLRQREILQLAAEGRTAKEIAALLSISPKTVDFHKNRIMRQLGLHNTAELARYAVKNGYIEA